MSGQVSSTEATQQVDTMNGTISLPSFEPPSSASALPKWIRSTHTAARLMRNASPLLEAGAIPQLLAVVQSPAYMYAAAGQPIPESRKPSSAVLASWQSDLAFAISALAMLSCDVACAKAIFDLGGLPILVLTLNVVQARTKANIAKTKHAAEYSASDPSALFVNHSSSSCASRIAEDLGKVPLSLIENTLRILANLAKCKCASGRSNGSVCGGGVLQLADLYRDN